MYVFVCFTILNALCDCDMYTKIIQKPRVHAHIHLCIYAYVNINAYKHVVNACCTWLAETVAL